MLVLQVSKSCPIDPRKDQRFHFVKILEIKKILCLPPPQQKLLGKSVFNKKIQLRRSDIERLKSLSRLSKQTNSKIKVKI